MQLTPAWWRNPIAGHADLATTAGAEYGQIQPGPVLELLLARGLQTGERDRQHGNHNRHTSGLAMDLLWRQGVGHCSLVLHEEGLNPVVVTLQIDPIGNGGGGLG